MIATGTLHSQTGTQPSGQSRVGQLGVYITHGVQRTPGLHGLGEYFQLLVPGLLEQIPEEMISQAFWTVWFKMPATPVNELQQDTSIGNSTWSNQARLISTIVELQHDNFTWGSGQVEPLLSDGGTGIEEYAVRSARVLQAVQWALSVSDVESFDDWMESTNSRILDMLVQDYPDVTTEAIRKVLASSDINVDAAVKALRQISKITDSRSHRERLNLLMGQLKASDARIRDAASVAMANLGDPKAIKFLQLAAETEPSSWVKRNLEFALHQLKG